ncbi:glycoside hydrolase family 18 protein [Candidatus Enterococcus leclercqii]|uniref:glycoside hydrolase family 18 protein n=1 Tax=Candidatus Enterococcus leclercqii TaxID=1857218 RepID=UPI0013794971|nr:glycoside hydrolase family 18 protein [Enterococcus sp. CU9D]KAF1291106.1 hypothetical protein BAU14_10995 [Enterococcus sp. CU9D]
MKEIIAYLDDNKVWEKEDIAAEKLTIINYAFANIIELEIVRELKKIHLVNELKQEHPHLRSCISIGGWSADGFSDGVATAENRHELIENLIAYMERYDFDGIDLDWEYPGMDLAGIKASPEDAANFLSFVKELREKLNELTANNGRSYLLTAAIGAAKPLLDTMSPNEKYEYIDYLDFVNVMTYDMRGSFTKIAGHHTNLAPYQGQELSVMEAVENLRAKNIPNEKIVIGCAFYSRIWRGFADTQHPVGAKAQAAGGETNNYNQLKPLFDAHPENLYWDEEAHAPYYFDGEQFMSFDDERSMKEKAEYVMAEELRGLMFWEYSLDLTGDLLRAAANVIQE